MSQGMGQYGLTAVDLFTHSHPSKESRNRCACAGKTRDQFRNYVYSTLRNDAALTPQKALVVLRCIANCEKTKEWRRTHGAWDSNQRSFTNDRWIESYRVIVTSLEACPPTRPMLEIPLHHGRARQLNLEPFVASPAVDIATTEDAERLALEIVHAVLAPLRATDRPLIPPSKLNSIERKLRRHFLARRPFYAESYKQWAEAGHKLKLLSVKEKGK